METKIIWIFPFTYRYLLWQRYALSECSYANLDIAYIQPKLLGFFLAKSTCLNKFCLVSGVAQKICVDFQKAVNSSDLQWICCPNKGKPTITERYSHRYVTMFSKQVFLWCKLSYIEVIKQPVRGAYFFSRKFD